MAYVIDRYNGTTIATVEDGTIDVTLDIKLIGKNYAGYGEIQNENFLHMLENFSGETAPPRPISGQLWYDSLTKKIKFYNNSIWKTVGAEPAGSKPSGGTLGDLWWDSVNKQLYSHDGTDFYLVGPQAAEGLGTTQMRSRSVLDDADVAHAIIEAIVDDEVVYVISTDEFTLNGTVNPILGFSLIKSGLTLINTSTSGVTSSDHKFWGTASNALKLNGTDANNFVTKVGGSFLDAATFVDAGFTVGDSNDLSVLVSGSDAYVKNQIGDRIVFQTTSSGTQTPMILLGASILPGVDLVSNIGSSSYKYNNIYANYLYGSAQQADALSVNGIYRIAAVSEPDIGDPDTIACRDASGNLRATEFQGTATSAYFADLAEKYLADQEYEVGTVVAVGGSKEVTACQIGDRAFGAVSANPAFKMNDGLVGGTYIALKGRVPVKVSGPVEKGDKLMAASNGTAAPAQRILKGQQVTSRSFPDTFAIALETNLDDGVKLVECVVL
jgi:hypothetical protein